MVQYILQHVNFFAGVHCLCVMSFFIQLASHLICTNRADIFVQSSARRRYLPGEFTCTKVNKCCWKKCLIFIIKWFEGKNEIFLGFASHYP